MLFHPLETERLWLKNISRADRDFILRQFSDADVTQYLFDAEPYTCLRQADALIDFYTAPEPRSQHRWILVSKADGAPIGSCGFHCWDRDGAIAELGYDLQKPYWGRGLMTEALGAAIPFAAAEMGLRRLAAHIYPENQRSVALAKKLGFCWQGDTVVYTWRDAPYLHHIYYRDL